MASKATQATPATPKVEALSHDAAVALIGATMSDIGSPLSVVAEYDTLTAEIDGRLIRWFGVAVKVKASGKVTAREFGTLTDTDKNWMGRLAAASSLHAAHKVKGLTLSARDAVKVANVQSAATIDGYVKSVRAGGDPLKTKAGTVKPSAGKSRKATSKDRVEVKASDMARIIGIIAANVGKASSEDQTLILAHAAAIVEVLTEAGVPMADLAHVEAEAESDAA